MSKTNVTTIRSRLMFYVESLFVEEEKRLKSIQSEVIKQGFDHEEIFDAQGKLLQVIIKMAGVKRILEIGTFLGYSTILMARALPPAIDSKVISIESDDKRASIARKFIQHADLVDIVEVRTGDALQLLPKMVGEEPFDLVFIDANEEYYEAFLHFSMRLVHPGSLIIADNVLMKTVSGWNTGETVLSQSKDPALNGILKFNESLATNPRLESIIIPTGSGMSLSFVK
jgi:caffeoyl-CoA O-methyltransferase